MEIRSACSILSLALFPALSLADHYDDIADSIATLDDDRAFENEDAKLYHLFDAIWEWNMREYPTWATYVGYAGQNDRWPDNSFEAEERRDQLDLTLLETLNRLDPTAFSESARLDWQLVTQSYETSIEGHAFPESLMPINQLEGPQFRIAWGIDTMPAAKVSDYQDILARLDTADAVIRNDLLRLKRGLQHGITPPQITLRDLPKQFDALLQEDVSETPFWKRFSQFPKDIPESTQIELADRASSIIQQKLQPALAELKAYLEDEYIPHARESIGYSSLPDGDAWYAYAAKVHTTTNLSPKEIHQIGLDEVARLAAKLKDAMTKIGFEGSFEEFKAFMQQDDQFYYTDPEELVRGYRAICKRADPELIKLFGTLPRLPYGVEVTPEHIAPSAPTAYYRGGSLEAGRPGVFFANTYDLRARPKWGMEALSLHEAVPGHHLQISLAKELGEVHELRKNLEYTAYIEGWGLYAETLGYEMGFYQDPYSEIGQITYEMWRAIRLVVDTGMHALGWSRQEAIDYFKANSILLEHDLTVEVDRYIVWPGQALAYKIGQLKYQELRDRAKEALGDTFNLRAYHDQVLGSGALPLNILEDRIDTWINRPE